MSLLSTTVISLPALTALTFSLLVGLAPPAQPVNRTTCPSIPARLTSPVSLGFRRLKIDGPGVVVSPSPDSSCRS